MCFLGGDKLPETVHLTHIVMNCDRILVVLTFIAGAGCFLSADKLPETAHLTKIVKNCDRILVVLTFIAGAGTLSGGASLVLTSSQRLLSLPTLL